ncbi:unnamed protein product [Urochloa decumbens]|uniref:Uncharacterized protein n=1 Tax=Urochloa decumbens TaxID=240449 RepID=A0ABC8ZNT2_9POAL
MAPAAAAVIGSSIRREEEEEAPMDAGAQLRQAGLLGIVTCATAITLAVRDLPPGLDKNAYFLAVAGAFFAGVAGILAAAARASNNPRPRGRRAAGRKQLIMYASLCPPLAVVIVIGLSAVSFLL